MPHHNIMKSNNSISICLLFVGLTICPDLLALKQAIRSFDAFVPNPGAVYNFESASVHHVDKDNTSVLSQVKSVTNSGPNQAETSGFSTTSTDDLVNKFTGDFNYSIPLMDVEGYPIVMNYNSNIGMHSEASWVGLGWDLNLGAVGREMRGLPDDFNGTDQIKRTHRVLDNIEGGGNGEEYAKKRGGYLSMNYKFQIGESNTFLKPGINVTLLKGSYHSTYLGNGTIFDLDFSQQFKLGIDDDFGNQKASLTPSFSLGYSTDSKRGVSTNTSFGIGIEGATKNGLNGALNIGYGRSANSRMGLINQSWSSSIVASKDIVRGSFSGSSSLSYGTMTSIPKVQIGSRAYSEQRMFKYGNRLSIGKIQVSAGYIQEKHKSRSELAYDRASEIPTITYQFFQPAFGYLHSGKRSDFEEKPDEYPVMDFERSSDYGFSSNMKNLAFSYQTYDIFNFGSAFTSGQFRAQRTDFGTFYDPVVTEHINPTVKDLGNELPDGVPEKLAEKLEFLTESNISNFHVGPALESLSGGEYWLGVDVGYGRGRFDGKTTSDHWSNGFQFISQNPSNNFDPTVFFKVVGEQTPTDMAAWSHMNGVNPVSFGIQTVGDRNFSLTGFVSGGINGLGLNNLNGKPIRATHIEVLTAEQANNSNIEYLSATNDCYTLTPSTLNRSGGYRKLHHVSKINVTSTDGILMEYGIPVYNVSNREVSFSASPIQTNGSLVSYSSTDASVDNTNGRSHLYDKTEMPAYAHSFLLTAIKSSDYIDRTGDGLTIDDVGSYVKFNYSKLTSDNAPYKWRFPVSQTSGLQEAFAVKGFEGSNLDDAASYSYGEKELWYARSVESKNYIAVFYTSDRLDGYPVQGESGFLNSGGKPTQKLDSIVLFLREEYVTKGCQTGGAKSGMSNATPLQKVIFNYNYELCHGAPNNIFAKNNSKHDTLRGKLTLTGIQVLSYHSDEMGLSSYRFDYNSGASFSYSNIDSWGEFKALNSNLPNAQFPYADQNPTQALNKAKGWKLKAIDTPTGGRIEVDYEADSYAFVQDKRAMSNLVIDGMTNVVEFLKIQSNSTWNGQSGKSLNFTSDLTNSNIVNNVGTIINLNYFVPFYGDDQLLASYVPNNVMIFKLEETISGGTPKLEADNLVAARYFAQNYNHATSSGSGNYLNKIHFKVKVKVKNGVDEYVTGFAAIHPGMNNALGNYAATIGLSNSDVKSYGVMPKVNGIYQYGYVVLENTSSGDIDVPDKKSQKKNELKGFVIHPIQKIALDFVRSNLPDKIYGACVNCDGDIGKKLDNRAIFGLDIYKYMLRDAQYVSSIYPSSAVMRLYDGDNCKFGGGARVAKIRYIDNWDKISKFNSSSEPATIYTWKYTYGNSNGESFGVASMEPKNSYDDSPQYDWNTYTNYRKKFPDDRTYTPTPVAIDLYPNAIVGYSKVKVEFEGSKNYGYSLSEYFTAKDFPTIEDYTDVQLDKPETLQSKFNPLAAIFGNSFSIEALRQGYTVQTNDFHGKIRQVRLYGPQDLLISRTSYTYVDPTTENKVKTVNRTLNVVEKSVGIEYDIHADSRFVISTTTFAIGGLELEVLFLLPLFVPPKFNITAYYAQAETESSFYTTTLIKHINRSAIVKSVETEYLGSINKADNLVWDEFSGEVLVSSLNDEFNDKLYSINTPAHWVHAEFREKTDQNGKAVTVPGMGSGVSLNPIARNFITPGDLVDLSGSPKRVASYYHGQEGERYYLTNLDGTTPVSLVAAGSNLNVVITKTNRKNRLSEIIQSTITKANPLQGGALLQQFLQETISSTAKSYRNKLSFQCVDMQDFEPSDFEPAPPPLHTPMVVEIGRPVDAYKYGAKGDLVIDGIYGWQGNRNHNLDNHGIRTSGTYSSFVPFYMMASNGIWYPYNVTGHPQQNVLQANDDVLSRWRKLSEPTLFDQYGKPLESKDQIDLFSSVLYGYSDKFGMIPIAQAVNAPKQSIAYDGFEDYSYYSTSNFPELQPHFSFKNQIQNSESIGLTNQVRHSGLQSLYIDGGNTLKKEIETGTHCPYNPDADNYFQFEVDECMCIKPFEPTQGEYVTSLWVKNGANMKLKITFLGDAILPADDQIGLPEALPIGSRLTIIKEFTPSGCVVDGWQRLEGTFEVPAGYPNFTYEIINSGTETMYVDDIRIHPFLAGMTTMVYDPKTLLPLATHDGYNYTTFYNYDENLMLSRVKVETECGIRTVSESEFSSYKTYK